MNYDLSIQFQPRDWLEAYQSQQYDQLSAKILRVLDHFESVTYLELTVEGRYFINVFVTTFLFLFLQPDYVIGDRHVTAFIHHNLTIANLLAISDLKQSDAYLEMLKLQPQNYVKILTLYSARNGIELPEKNLFAVNSELASLWFSRYLDGCRSGLGDRPIYQKMRDHLAQLEDSFQPIDRFVELYSSATCIDGEREQPLKRQIHRGLRNYFATGTLPALGTPDPQRLAVVTQFWHPDEPIYRGFSRWVAALCHTFTVDLWHIGPPTAATDGFRGVTVLECQEGRLDLNSLEGHGVMAVCFLEVGRSLESLWLANLRLAPVQIACLGHPVTTAGAELDYFISGGAVELGRGAEQFYSERLVLLPNAGLELAIAPVGELPVMSPPDPLVVLCPWELPTLNHPLLQLLRKILKESRVPICFRLLVGTSLNRYNDYLACRQEVQRALGDHFELLPTKTHSEWRAQMALGHLCLDSYPVGAPWAIATALSLGIPAITLEGKRWYNRASAWLLRQYQCPELVAKTPSDYGTAVLKLVHDPEARRLCAEHLRSQPPISGDGGESFQRAIALLINNHHRWQSEPSRRPIRI